MKKLLIVTAVLLLFWPARVMSSDPKMKLTWSQDYQLPKGNFPSGFIGNLKDGFVQISEKYGKNITFQRFSPALKLTSEKTIDLKSMPKGYMIDRFVEWNGTTYMFYSTWDKKAGREHLFVQKMDVIKGDLSGNASQLIETDKVTGDIVLTRSFSFNYQAANKYKISFSSDSGKMFVYVKYAREKGEARGSNEEFGLWVFDKNFKVLWTKRVKMPYEEKKMTLEDVQCDRQGEYLFLAKAYNDDSRKDIKDNAPNYHFEILRFKEGSDKPVIIPFDFKDRYVSQLTLLEDLDGNVVCCGFYGDKDNKGKLRAISGKVDGSFFLRLDLEKNSVEKIHKGFYPIPDSWFKEYIGEKAEKKVEKKEAKGEELSASNMLLRHVIFGADGSLMLLGEQYYYVVTTHSDGKMTYTTTTYYFLDILAQYIDASGELAWTKKIPKRQIGGQLLAQDLRCCLITAIITCSSWTT